MKSGNLNFLEPSGTIQACKGTALPLLLLYNEIYFCRIGWEEFVPNLKMFSFSPVNVEEYLLLPSCFGYFSYLKVI